MEAREAAEGCIIRAQANSRITRGKQTDPQYPWVARKQRRSRYFGLSAVQLDVIVLGVAAIAAVCSWVFLLGAGSPADIFNGAGDDISSVRQALELPSFGDRAPAVQPAGSANGATPPAVVADARQAFAASSQKLAETVQSFHGRMDMKMSLGDVYFGSGGDISFKAPDSMYMTMDVGGQNVEFLAVLPDMYIKEPGKGWYKLDGAAFGMNPDALRKYLDDRGPFDFSRESKALQGLTQLPDDEIDGVSYLHYSGTLDFTELAGSLPGGLLDPKILDQAKQAIGPVTMETWLDKETMLPRRQKVNMSINAGPTSMKMDMSMDFTDFNQPVDIPAPPVDAQPLESLGV